MAECSDIMDFMIFQADFDIYYGISDVYESTPLRHTLFSDTTFVIRKNS